MDFFAQQERAKRNTTVLIGYFMAGVGALIVSLYLVATVVFTGTYHRRHYYGDAPPPDSTLWHPQLFLGVAFFTLAVIVIGSVVKTMELASGGSAVADMMDGDLVSSNTTDSDERKLLNVVEEMAIASGVPVPSVYVMRRESGINAFAAGHSTSDAVVCVTRGCMRLLTRDELQGVIGHEFSHILNGDMRLNLRLMGIIFGIVCLTTIGRILFQFSGNERKNPLPFVGLALIILGAVGAFFGHLIQAAVSRQREFLADASSVQFTRNPAGLAGALKKIGGLSSGSRLHSARAAEASHMFFGSGVESPLFALFATHPPLAERIRAIDPSFDGNFPVIDENLMAEPLLRGKATNPLERIPSPIPFPGGNFPGMPVPPIITQAAMGQMSRPTPQHLRYADGLRNVIPETLRACAREPFGASALIYALLLSTDATERDKKFDLIAQNTSITIRQETIRILPEAAAMAQHAKLPLVDLALPALRQLSQEQYTQFKKTLDQLIDSDGHVDMFEYLLRKIVLRHLDAKFSGARKPTVQFYALKGVAEDCDVLLSALAHAGQDTPAAIADAFQQGAAFLSGMVQINFTLLPPDHCGLDQLDASLNRLDQAVPQIKKNVLTACAKVVAADGIIQESEAELLRTIAEALDCPMPPFVQPE